MKLSKFRITHKTFYRDDTTTEDYPVITKVERPVVQVKILWFWFTIKEFVHYFRIDAEEQAKKLYECLTNKSYKL